MSGASGAGAHRDSGEPRHRPWLAIVLVVALAVGLGVALVGLPREHAALPAIARRALAVALPRWHITEPVNEVVYGTRGFDTFGETFLLLAAVVSVVLLTRRSRSQGRGGGRGGRRRTRGTPRSIPMPRSPTAGSIWPGWPKAGRRTAAAGGR